MYLFVLSLGNFTLRSIKIELIEIFCRRLELPYRRNLYGTHHVNVCPSVQLHRTEMLGPDPLKLGGRFSNIEIPVLERNISLRRCGQKLDM